MSSKPSSLVDVFLTDLSSVWRDESHAFYTNSIIYPWFCDESTSWIPNWLTQEETYRGAFDTARVETLGTRIASYDDQVGSRCLHLRIFEAKD